MPVEPPTEVGMLLVAHQEFLGHGAVITLSRGGVSQFRLRRAGSRGEPVCVVGED